MSRVNLPETFQWPDVPEDVRLDPGPYVESWGEGPGIWLPRHLWTWPKARSEASLIARESGGSVAVYKGKADCRLDIAEGGPWIEGVPCYTFEAEDRPR